MSTILLYDEELTDIFGGNNGIGRALSTALLNADLFGQQSAPLGIVAAAQADPAIVGGTQVTNFGDVVGYVRSIIQS